MLIPFCAASVVGTGGVRFPRLVGTVIHGALRLFRGISHLRFRLGEVIRLKCIAFAYLQPVMAALMGIWLLGEKISIAAVFGGILILFGLYLTEDARGERQNIEHMARDRV